MQAMGVDQLGTMALRFKGLFSDCVLLGYTTATASFMMGSRSSRQWLEAGDSLLRSCRFWQSVNTSETAAANRSPQSRHRLTCVSTRPYHRDVVAIRERPRVERDEPASLARISAPNLTAPGGQCREGRERQSSFPKQVLLNVDCA